MGITAILTAASVGMQALGSIQQGKAAAASAKYNAQVQQNNAEIARRNAQMAIEKGNAAASAEQQKTRANVGAIKAAQAASGVDVGSESAVDVRSSAAELGMLNTISIRSNAAREAYGYQTRELDALSQSQLDTAQGKSAKQAGYMDAGGTILGGAKPIKDAWGDYNNSKSLFPWQQPGNVNPAGGYY